MPSGPIEPGRAARSRRPSGSRCRCTAVSVFMKTNCVGIQRGADAIGRIDHHRQSLKRCRRLRIHQRHKRTQPDLGGGASGVGCLRQLTVSRYPGAPSQRVRHRAARPRRAGVAVGGGVAGVAGGEQPGADAGHRASPPSGRSAIMSAHISEIRRPAVPPRPEPAPAHRDGAEDVQRQAADPQPGPPVMRVPRSPWSAAPTVVSRAGFRGPSCCGCRRSTRRLGTRRQRAADGNRQSITQPAPPPAAPHPGHRRRTPRASPGTAGECRRRPGSDRGGRTSRTAATGSAGNRL